MEALTRKHSFYQYSDNVRLDRREPFLDGLPHQLMIDAEIEVDQLVPHPRHFAPGNLSMFLADFVGDLLGGFTNDFLFLDHLAGGLIIRLKCLLVQSGNKFIDAVDAVDGVQDIFQI